MLKFGTSYSIILYSIIFLLAIIRIEVFAANIYIFSSHPLNTIRKVFIDSKRKYLIFLKMC